jgi:membrane peptidoglycan carboxypeptidase
MRSTLAMSLNVPAVKVLYLVGIDNTIDLAHRMGITTLNERNRYGLSLVLGGGEVKLLDMTEAFSVFANEGMRNPMQYAIKITDAKGNIVEQENASPVRVLDVQVARKINSILSDNNARTPIFGSHSALVIDGKTVAAKTGTTTAYRDAWTVGYTPSIAVGVWAGNNNNSPLRYGADGVFVAAPMWKDFMIRVLANRPNETFIAYDNYQKNDIQKIEDNGTKVRTVVTYYNKKTGKKMSEERALKADQEKVERRVEYVTEYSSTSMNESRTDETVSIALPSINDPMYKKWTSQLNDGKDRKDDKKSKKKK